MHYNKYYHAFRCVQSLCVLVGLDCAEPMMYLLCMSHIHAFSHAYVLYFSIYTCYLIYFGAFLIASFFPLSILFTLVMSMVLKRKSTPAWNPLHFDAFFSSDHAPLFLSVFVMMMPTRHLRKTFSNLAFIRNAESFY